jgi:hypothetical protein
MTRVLLPAAAAAIVCLTNVGALSLAAINRTGAPDAEITLTERELQLARSSESTATAVRLTWVQRFDPEGEWLTCPKLAAIGVSCAPRTPGEATSRWYAREPPRSAYVVFEYDGPAWQAYRAVEARRLAESARTYQNAAPDIEATLARYSHLVAIDAGRDPAALRGRYPDGRRYLIVAAHIAIYPETGAANVRLRGTITEVTPATINVPRPFSSTFESMLPYNFVASADSAPRYWVTLRFGRFHEPWVVNAGLSR